MVDYGNVCKTLESLMLELIGKGLNVPQHIYDGLNSVRSLIVVYTQNSDELCKAIEKSPVLQEIEMSLLIAAEANFGKDYADGWQQKIMSAYRESEKSVKTQTYVTGIPKENYWIRLKTDTDVEGLSKSLNLQTKPQKDGCLLIHGRKEDVKTLLNKIREETGKQL